jgi:hypothetical protein
MITKVDEFLFCEGIKQAQSHKLTVATIRGISSYVWCEKLIKMDKIATVFVHNM